MVTLTLKNIPDALYERLRQSSSIRRRSLNSEILVILEQALASHPLEVDEVLKRARRIRERSPAYILSDDEISAAKSEGRP